MIDLSSLFKIAPGGDDITNYVNYNATTGILSVDADGLTGGASFVTAATLTGHPAAASITLTFIDSNNIILSTTANNV